MKMQSYSRAVDPNVAQGQVRAPGNAAAYGAGMGRAMGAVAQGLALVGAEQQRQMENDLALKVMEASNEYERQINVVNTDLLSRQLDKTIDIDKEFAEKEAKIRQKVWGESGLRYEKAQRAFNNMADRSVTGNLKVLSRYQAGEMDKHGLLVRNESNGALRDKVLLGKETAQNALGQMKISNAIYGRNKGQDYIKALDKDSATELVGVLMLDLTDKKDYAGAQAVYDEFKEQVDVARLSKVTSRLNDCREAEQGMQDINSLYAIYGDDVDGAVKAWSAKATKSGSGDKDFMRAAESQLGIPYVLGGDGKSSTDCGKFIERTATAAGYETTNLRTVDDMYKVAEDKGIAFTDRSQLQPGDIVYYCNTSSQAGEAYKGITHAGIYQGNGKLMHASSGYGKVIKDADMDAIGEIAGFSRIPFEGGKTGRSLGALETEDFRKKYSAKLGSEISARNFKRNEAYQNGMVELFKLREAGIFDETASADVVSRYSYDDHTRMRLKGLKTELLTKPKRESSETAALYRLDTLAINGQLQQDDVEMLFKQGALSDKDFLKYSKDAGKTRKDEANDLNNQIDKAWFVDVNAQYSDPKTKAVKERFAVMAKLRLDQENVQGWERQDKVRQWLKDEKATPTIHTEYYQHSSREYNVMVNSWGARGGEVGELLKRGALTEGTGGSGQELNKTSSYIAAQISTANAKGDPTAQAALDHCLDEGIPLTKSSYDKIRGMFTDNWRRGD